MNLEKLSAKNYIELIKSKKISVTEATSFFLNRSKSINDKINSLITLEDKILFKRPTQFSKPLAQIKKGKVLIIQKCNIDWCKIKSKNIKGWIKKDNTWGFY